MEQSTLNWPKIRNAIRKRLKLRGLRSHALDDATQDACGFAILDIRSGTEPGLAVYRAVSRAAKGHTLTYSPKLSDRWEREYDRSCRGYSPNGMSQASRRAAHGLPLSGATVLE